MFDLPVVSVRFSSVYGPMDRITPARHHACAANRMAHIARQGRPVRVNAPEARDDSIYAPDVAEALVRMLRAPVLAHPVYNIAYGEALSLAELAGAAGVAIETAPEDRCDIIGDPARGGGRYGAYDISRLTDELGWRPRPIADAMRAYVEWIGEWEEG
jgi:UDP-glucose 4-epimerase